jgi:hypothetical protein
VCSSSNTGACFAPFVSKYWSSACRLCAKLPVLGLLLVAINFHCLSKLPVIVFSISMYANVSCRCMVAIASEMPSCDWIKIKTRQKAKGMDA